MLFRHAVEAGKRARTDTAISRNVTSVSQAAVAMAAERLDGLAGRRVLVLGAGEMGEGVVGCARRCRGGRRPGGQPHLGQVDRAGRSSRRPGRSTSTTSRSSLAAVDLLLTSTGASSIMVEHGDLEPVMAQRGGIPLLVVDIAVPRDVDPAAGDLDGVTLLDMDDLRAFAEAGVAERQREVAAVRTILDEELDRYVAVSSAREVAPLVAAIHDRAEGVRQGELERFRARLEALDPTDREAVEAVTRRIVAKLLHEPTVRLKDAAGTARGERLAETLRELYGI